MPACVDVGRFLTRLVFFSVDGPISLTGEGLTIESERRVPTRAWLSSPREWPALPAAGEGSTLLVDPLPGLRSLLVMVPTPPHFTAVRAAVQSAGLNLCWESLNTALVGGGDVVALLEREPVDLIITRTGRVHLPALLEGVKLQRAEGHLRQLVILGEGERPGDDWLPLQPFHYIRWPNGDWPETVKHIAEALSTPVDELLSAQEETAELEQRWSLTAQHRPRALAALARRWAAATDPTGEESRFSLYDLETGRVSSYTFQDQTLLRSSCDVWGQYSPGLAPTEDWGATAPAAGLDTLPTAATISQWLPFATGDSWLEDCLANALMRPFTLPQSNGELAVRLALLKELSRRNEIIATHNQPAVNARRRPPRRVLMTGAAVCGLNDPLECLLTALDVAVPQGTVALYWDAHGVAPHLGASALSGQQFHSPLNGNNAPLRHLATCLAPYRQTVDWQRPSDQSVAILRLQLEGESEILVRLNPGTLVRVSATAGRTSALTIEPNAGFDFGAGPGRTWRGKVECGQLGLICDTRGRPLALPADDLTRINRLRDWHDSIQRGL